MTETVLWQVLAGTRGGRNRVRILQALDERPRNCNQLAEELELNYNTVRHHLEVLEDNGVLRSTDTDYGAVYLITDRTRRHWEMVTRIVDRPSRDHPGSDRRPTIGPRRPRQGGSMSALLTVARAAALFNVALLAAVAAVWASNHRRIGSKQTFGTLVFAVLLLAENGLALYYHTLSGIEPAAPAAAR